MYPERKMSFIEGVMSSAQFIYMNAPVIAVQRGGGMGYLGEDGERGWSSTLRWPRANLQMARLVDAVEDETGRD